LGEGIVILGDPAEPLGTSINLSGGSSQTFGRRDQLHGRRHDEQQLHADHRRHGDVHRQLWRPINCSSYKTRFGPSTISLVS
jgi:hypothetical protein